MDAELLIEEVQKLQKLHGEHINVLVNHGEILLVAFMTPIPKEDEPGHVNISSEEG